MSGNLRKRFPLFIHLGVWSLFFALPLLPMYLNHVPPTPVVTKVYFQLTLVAVLFYINYFWLIPALLFKRKRGLYLLVVGGCILLMVTMNGLVSEALNLEAHLPKVVRDHQPFIPRSVKMEIFPVFVSLLAVSVGVAIRFSGKWFQEQTDLEGLEKERLETELAFLKAQINPHFFFNTMNLIYALTETDPAQAQQAIHKLSKLMRYVLYESERERVALDREIAFLNDYIDLMRMRLPEHVKVEFVQNIRTKGAVVPPLLFVPFVENALKHGVSSQGQESIRFALESGETLKFSSRNAIHANTEVQKQRKGVGLVNVKRRLGLLYPAGAYQLEIEEKNREFTVNLQIPLG